MVTLRCFTALSKKAPNTDITLEIEGPITAPSKSGSAGEQRSTEVSRKPTSGSPRHGGHHDLDDRRDPGPGVRDPGKISPLRETLSGAGAGGQPGPSSPGPPLGKQVRVALENDPLTPLRPPAPQPLAAETAEPDRWRRFPHPATAGEAGRRAQRRQIADFDWRRASPGRNARRERHRS